MRATPQRRHVYEAVIALEHSTPEQICSAVQTKAAGTNLSTVYRSLDVLEDLGLVSHTHLGHGSPTYHSSSHADHLHLVCRVCGSVTEAHLGLADALAASLARDHGFAADLSHLSLHGVCDSCSQQRTSATDD